MANDYRNTILGISERKSALNEWQMKMIYKNDWIPLQFGITASFCVFMFLYASIPFYYESSHGEWWSGLGSALLMLIATVGNAYGFFKDRASILEHIERNREIKDAE